MNTNRKCGCKSFRTCYICEEEFGLKPWDWGQQLRDEQRTFYHYSLETKSCNVSGNPEQCHNLSGFSGIQIIPNFVSEEEQFELVTNLDKLPWDVSQSGRRKQNFGPKANFKKRKAKVGNFKGFPECTKFIQSRFHTVPELEGYRTVEQCSIEYSPKTGACIEPHIDDCWIWGERIVQLNLLSDSYLTLTPVEATGKYNLSDVPSYPRVLDRDGATVLHNPFSGKLGTSCYEVSGQLSGGNLAVKVPLPARSLLVMSGAARYEWEHAILRRVVLYNTAIPCLAILNSS